MESEIEEAISEEEAISLLDQATQNDQAEFKNAFDVLKFEGRRWNLLKSMKSFPFVMMILLVIGQVSISLTLSRTLQKIITEDVGMGWIYVYSFLFLWFIIKLFKKLPSKVSLSLDDVQKEKLKNILESLKGFKGIKSRTKTEWVEGKTLDEAMSIQSTEFEVTKKLNQGETEIGFPKFTGPLGYCENVEIRVLYFLPEGIAYKSGKNFELLDIKIFQ